MAVVSIAREHFRVGDRAPSSGIYRAVHSRHRKHHMVIVIRGEAFPPCRFCKSAVVFTLVDSTPYVAHDLDFAGPEVEVNEG